MTASGEVANVQQAVAVDEGGKDGGDAAGAGMHPVGKGADVPFAMRLKQVSWWVGGLAGEFVGPRLAGIRYAVGSAWNFGWVGERSCDVLAFCFTRVFLGRK